MELNIVAKLRFLRTGILLGTTILVVAMGRSADASSCEDVIKHVRDLRTMSSEDLPIDGRSQIRFSSDGSTFAILNKEDSQERTRKPQITSMEELSALKEQEDWQLEAANDRVPAARPIYYYRVDLYRSGGGYVGGTELK